MMNLIISTNDSTHSEANNNDLVNNDQLNSDDNNSEAADVPQKVKVSPASLFQGVADKKDRHRAVSVMLWSKDQEGVYRRKKKGQEYPACICSSQE